MKALVLALTLMATNDDAAIRATIEHYFRAHATGDGSHLMQAFRPELHVMSVNKDGALQMRTRDEFAKVFSGKPADDEAQRKRTIEMIDISGNAAIAKLKLDYPKITFIDYFTLLKIDGEWKVVNKTFSAHPKQ